MFFHYSDDDRSKIFPCLFPDERPDLSTAELKLKTQKQLKGKKKEKKNRLKSRNASAEKCTLDEKPETILDSLTNIVITTASQIVSTIR